MKRNELSAKWGSLSPKDQKLLLTLALGLIVGVLLMSWGRGVSGAASAVTATATSATTSTTSEPEKPPGLYQQEPEDELEKKLEKLLCQVKGAGKVQVALTYADSAAAVYAYDNSTRTTTGESSSSQDNESRMVEINDQPVLVSTTSPRIRGVLVVAEGGGDPLVKERLYQALGSLLGINAAQIAIIEAEGSIDNEN